MKTLPVAAELFRAHGRTEGRERSLSPFFFAILRTRQKVSNFNETLLHKQPFRLTQFPGTRLFTCCCVSNSSTY
jgi:hypothetical protein